MFCQDHGHSRHVCSKRADTLLEIARYFHTRWRALAHGLLLAMLFPRDTATGTASDAPASCAFNNGLCEAPWAALWGVTNSGWRMDITDHPNHLAHPYWGHSPPTP
jgi:hypothetical protein